LDGQHDPSSQERLEVITVGSTRVVHGQVVVSGLVDVEEAGIQVNRNDQAISIPFCLKPATLANSYAFLYQILRNALLERAEVYVEGAAHSASLTRKTIDRRINEAVYLLHRYRHFMYYQLVLVHR